MPDTSHFLRDYNWLEENKPEDVRFGDIVVLFFLVNVDIVVLSFLVNVDIVVLFFFSNLEVVGLISLVRFNSVILTADHDVLTPTALQQLAQLHHKVMFLGENIEEYFLGLHFETNNKIEKHLVVSFCRWSACARAQTSAGPTSVLRSLQRSRLRLQRQANKHPYEVHLHTDAVYLSTWRSEEQLHTFF